MYYNQLTFNFTFLSISTRYQTIYYTNTVIIIILKDLYLEFNNDGQNLLIGLKCFSIEI